MLLGYEMDFHKRLGMNAGQEKFKLIGGLLNLILEKFQVTPEFEDLL